jgi:hypothetical protein
VIIDLAVSSSSNRDTASVIKSGQTPLSSPASKSKYGVRESVVGFGSRLENVSIRYGTFQDCQRQNVPFRHKKLACMERVVHSNPDEVSERKETIFRF